VDIHQQLIVIDASETRDQLLTLINPEILEQDGVAGLRRRLLVGARDLRQGCARRTRRGPLS
jgi:hypothetical protein